jgi:hypothetical protein
MLRNGSCYRKSSDSARPQPAAVFDRRPPAIENKLTGWEPASAGGRQLSRLTLCLTRPVQLAKRRGAICGRHEPMRLSLRRFGGVTVDG